MCRTRHAIASAAAAVALGLVPAAPASAAEVIRCGADARTALTLTLYAGDLGLVQETRSLDLPAGASTVEFADVPEPIDPGSLLARPADGPPFRLVERRLEQDLIGPDRLLDLSVGKPVELHTRDERGEQVVTATLLTTRGPIYEIDGKIWIGHPGTVVVPEMPAGLRERPALVLRIEADRAGRRSVEAAYLTGGLGWEATYAARLSPGEDSAALEGWVTVHNRTGLPFRKARLRLVAGDVRRAPRPIAAQAMEMKAMGEGFAQAPTFEEEAAFEYHLYTLDREVDLPDRESSQVLLRAEASMPARKFLTFTGQPYHPRGQIPESRGLHPEVDLEIDNRGAPLPAGLLRVYQDAGGGLRFLGEGQVGHTPEGGTVRLAVGRAFDVEADRIPVDVQAVASGRYDREVAFRIEIRNHKDVPAAVRLREPISGDWKLVESQPAGTKLDAGTLGFELTVPARAAAVVTYRVALDLG
jgi:hypothetical protein